MKFISIIVMAFLILTTSNAQEQLQKKLTGAYNPMEMVSISKYVSYDQAVKMLSSVSEIVAGKTIVSTVSSLSPIGVEITQMPYMDALNLIVNSRNLMYEEKAGSIIIKQKDQVDDTEEGQTKGDTYADIGAREVRISAVFFEANIQNSLDKGIDWDALVSKGGVDLGSALQTQTIPPATQLQSQATPPSFNITNTSSFNFGKWQGNATAMFRFFQSENLGEIITSPSVTVRNKQKGRIQVGDDFSVLQKDFSGNTIQRFYSAGSIINVTPYVYSKDGIDYILLKLDVEQSSVIPSELTTDIKKTAASTDVLLLDGEETVIGGLYINDNEIVRTGIPFLKDLPWWVFGIRFLTGSDKTVVTKKEVIILLRAELIPTLNERFKQKSAEKKNLIKEKIEKDKKDLENRKSDYIKDENK
jgi:general secretion pathway protein D